MMLHISNIISNGSTSEKGLMPIGGYHLKRPWDPTLLKHFSGGAWDITLNTPQAGKLSSNDICGITVSNDTYERYKLYHTRF